MKQTIAIIGAGGNMGSGLARNLAGAGHRILLAGRHQSKVNDLLVSIKASTPRSDVDLIDCSREASWEADIVIPAVPYQLEKEVATQIKDVVAGKIVVSISNPLNQTYDGLLTEPTTSAAEELSQLLPHSRIVKAFNTVSAEDFTFPEIGGRIVDCFVAGDDRAAVATVSRLVQDAGFRPVIAGDLSASRTLERMMLLLIGLALKNNYGWNVGWKVLHHEQM